MLFYSLAGLVQLFALLIFAFGFFPSKSPIPGFATHESQKIDGAAQSLSLECLEKISNDKPLIDQLVIVVIDALRSDYLFDEETPMTFIRSLVESGNRLAFNAHVQSPTVTMPRIKAFTSGTVPAFLDIVLNLASSGFSEDSIIAQLQKNNQRIAFYGDETWLQLFPNTFLQRSEGTVSFFVKDYTEVDDNVTRHLDHELKHWNSWDVMILHYLGLDHIGHSLGPKSPVLPGKLREMDSIVRKIYHSLTENNRSFGMVILGDHGMTDGGSHGGSSDQETLVPLVFLSPQMSATSVFIDGKRVEQIDMVPTVSGLLGLPIPQNNLGAMLIDVLSAFKRPEQLHKQLSDLMLVHANAVQISKVYESRFGSEMSDQLDQFTRRSGAILDAYCRQGSLPEGEPVSALIAGYLSMIQEMQGRLLVSFANYDMDLIYIGLGMSLMVTLSLVLRLLYKYYRQETRQWPSFSTAILWVGLALHAISLFASSFVEEEHQIWYWLLPSYLILFGFQQVGKLLVHGKDEQSKSSKNDIVKLLIILVLHRVLRAWNQTGDKWAHLPDIGDWLNQPSHKNEVVFLGIGSIILITLILLHRDRHRLRISHFLCVVGLVLVAFAHFSFD
uniref:GPI ethanolamine phosphate transferase 2 n=1 Tax=Plectus sambesii TaxID=2011161 RepID=A0A914VRR0_9BILA